MSSIPGLTDEGFERLRAERARLTNSSRARRILSGERGVSSPPPRPSVMATQLMVIAGLIMAIGLICAVALLAILIGMG